jgi:hypothetical protein
MKLLNHTQWYARVEMTGALTKPDSKMDGHFPFDIGAVHIKKDDRSIVLDPFETAYFNEDDGKVRFLSKLEIDQDVFTDCKHDITIADLTSDPDCEMHIEVAEESDAELEVKTILLTIFFGNQGSQQLEIPVRRDK